MCVVCRVLRFVRFLFLFSVSCFSFISFLFFSFDFIFCLLIPLWHGLDGYLDWIGLDLDFDRRLWIWILGGNMGKYGKYPGYLDGNKQHYEHNEIYIISYQKLSGVMGCKYLE
ncbi:hypothetical protein ASPWEDRAFT_469899 [Aspergillus wentii DTO 134E9]|uniref:Uncharacterized protein n=1 Tax=Aspergillus wentii DTO 134E9 TaxID=1073089 RepID=A0A1L9RS13_ASPWE|nr:uncharacterized protein ASPWEDRAFT_469899 [Aspergillus wentii DTO 134E9]OJJ37756.1 hypothetical protein ASPWEDRAFT_469899 [Aspergillus wentii DTO 134E9]